MLKNFLDGELNECTINGIIEHYELAEDISSVDLFNFLWNGTPQQIQKDLKLSADQQLKLTILKVSTMVNILGRKI